ncbi:hypothetical protein CAOG_03954 [Capsaspora owczarzaki ATCC 30864]|uniref:MYND-type domain-containing protein n=1 Tax=Capsaspora owczarzaki (strain ATCC 30864) TaxID=595528 RepID=A0A0D2UDM0_CAPO3|nr:hypothetical protein CAOG_03954 [Capsaspora owczarzaki ATCC 30864]KJE93121.1 hypothetical protein CAOG_003954 [Capsaspora owczarzaki ATCC 30864]|eukprot:XP_004363682.2 hypothetical protein CAOG_03954 [Capsaspora owczarzaki ATCC 30864]
MSLISPFHPPQRITPRAAKLLDRHSLALAYTPALGRHITAKRDFRAGELVLASKPYAAVADTDGPAAGRCSECFQAQDEDADVAAAAEMKRCAQCRRAQYCSVECQRAAWHGGHKAECAAWVRGLQPYTKDGVLDDDPVAINEVNLAARIIDARMSQVAGSSRTLPPPPPPSQDDLESPTFEDVALMLSNALPLARANAKRYASNAELAALLATRYSGGFGPDFDKLTPELLGEEGRLFSTRPEQFMLHLLCVMQCNNFAIHNDILFARGSGIYPVAALVNHACVANCVLTYDLKSKRQFIRAIRDIRAGEEITHAFTDAASPTVVRKAHLKSLYAFDCNCSRCNDSDAAKELDAELVATRPIDTIPAYFKRFRLERLAGLPSLLERATRDVPKVSSPADVEALLQASRSWLQEGMDPRLPTARAIVLLVTAWAVRQALLGDYNLELFESNVKIFGMALLWREEALSERQRDLALVSGLRNVLVDSARHVIRVYQRIYPANHPLLGLQWFSLGDIYSSDNDGARAKDAHARALAILTITHGPTNPLVNSLRRLVHE